MILSPSSNVKSTENGSSWTSDIKEGPKMINEN